MTTLQKFFRKSALALFIISFAFFSTFAASAAGPIEPTGPQQPVGVQGETGPQEPTGNYDASQVDASEVSWLLRRHRGGRVEQFKPPCFENLSQTA